MNFELNGPMKTALFLTGGIAVLALIGWLTEGSEDNGKSKKRGGFSPEQFQQLSQEEQQRYLRNMQQQREATSKEPQSVKELMQLLQRAELAKNRAKYDEAESLYLEAIELIEKEKDIGAEHHYYGLVSYALSLNLKLKGDLPTSETWMKKAIGVFESQNIPEAADQTADALATLADLYLAMKKPKEAEEPIQKSLNLVLSKLSVVNGFEPKNSEENNEKGEALQKINQELGILYDTYARVKFDLKQYAESEELAKKSLLFLLSGFGEDKTAEPFITRAILKLGECFLAQNKTQEASDLYGKLIAEQKQLGNELTEASYCRLFGTTALLFKCYDLAEQYFEHATSILENHEDNPKVLSDFVEILSTLVSIKTEAGREEQDIKSTIHRLVTQVDLLEMELPLSKSSYFTTKEAAVQYNIDQSLGNFIVNPYFTFTITVNENVEIPSDSVLVVEYPRMKEEEEKDEEDEEEEEEEEEEVKYSRVELPVNSSTLIQSKTFTFESPKLTKLDENYYLLNVSLYSDALQTTRLIRHPIIVKCPMDTSSVSSKEEFEEKL